MYNVTQQRSHGVAWLDFEALTKANALKRKVSVSGDRDRIPLEESIPSAELVH